jgi:short-subunit dehydrogenase
VALAVPTDVRDESAVQELARRADERFGGFDVWVNNAAVTVLGRFEQIPTDVMRRLFEINVFGYTYGMRAALERFRRDGRGVLINNVSVYGMMTAPYWSMYAATKWAVRGMTDAVRQELRGTNVRVCTVLPSAIDTPLWHHAANFSGRAIKAVNPTYDPMKVARTIVRLAERPRREVVVGSAGRLQGLLHALSPRLFDAVTVRQMERDQFRDESAPDTRGNVFEPMPTSVTVDGGWRDGTALVAAGHGHLRPSTGRLAAGLAALVP